MTGRAVTATRDTRTTQETTWERALRKRRRRRPKRRTDPTEGAGGALPAQAPSTGLSDEGDFDMEREAAEAEADLESDVTPPSYDMRQDLSGAAGTPPPTGVTPASDAGSTSENSGDLSYLDDAAEGDGDEGGEDDSGDDQVELTYLDDDAADPEMSYLEGPGGAEDRGSSEGEADVAEDASCFGSDGGEAGGGGEAVVGDRRGLTDSRHTKEQR